MAATLTIAPVTPEQHAAAFRLAFQHLPTKEREGRVANALGLIDRGELDPAGIFVASVSSDLVGSMICMTVPGASGLVWPPQALAKHAERTEIEDQLIQVVSAWLRQRGTKLAQALLVADDVHLGAPLLRNGFAHITRLWYLRHNLELIAQVLPGERLSYLPYLADTGRFHETLLRSYADSQDCPEVTGVRTIDEIMDGHRSQGNYDPERWWLALAEDVPVGVLLLTETPELGNWDISYVGVVPEARGRGIGAELIRKALVEARVGAATQLTLSVDARNRPACRLYHRLGFERFDEREVFLAIWSRT